MKLLTPWRDARNKYKELDTILLRQAFLASLERDLSTEENDELRALQESVESWGERLGIE